MDAQALQDLLGRLPRGIKAAQAHHYSAELKAELLAACAAIARGLLDPGVPFATPDASLYMDMCEVFYVATRAHLAHPYASAYYSKAAAAVVQPVADAVAGAVREMVPRWECPRNADFMRRGKWLCHVVNYLVRWQVPHDDPMVSYRCRPDKQDMMRHLGLLGPQDAA